MADPDTKTRILDAAEHLFAAQGFAAVSLRAIIKAAGVNTASVHYHFGSKERLIEAVLERRAAPINIERIEWLDRIEARHPSGPLPLEKVLEALLAPVIRIHEGPSEMRGLLPQLLGRAITELEPQTNGLMRSIFFEVFHRFSAALARALPGLSRDELNLRVHFVIGALAFTMVGPHAFEAETPPVRDNDVDRITRSLVAFAAAGLRAESGLPG